MDETNRDFIEYSVNVWAKKIGVLPSKFKKLAENCAETGLISLAIRVQTDKKLSIKRSEMYKITSPNLLKYRDNHTKNLQVACKQEVELEEEKEVELEVEKEVKKKTKTTPLAPATADAGKIHGDTELQSACRSTWKSYCTAYFNRYGTEPTRNAGVNSMVKQFVQKIGYEEAPLVAEFYVNHNERFYVSKIHPVSLMNKDAEGLRTQWATGRGMTATRANQIDKSQANYSVVAEVMEMMEAEKRAENS
jgi:hypothetical protein